MLSKNSGISRAAARKIVSLRNCLLTMTQGNQLNLIVGLNGFSFLVVNPENKTFQAPTQVDFAVADYRKTTEEQYWEAFLKYPELTRNYEKVTIFHKNAYATFVPNELYDEGQPELYLQFATKLFETDSFDIDEIPELGVKNVFVPYVHINNFLLDQFDTFEYHHFETALCKQFQKIAAQRSDKLALAYVDKNLFSLYVFQGSNLLFNNTFEILKPADFVYYLLFTAEQLELDPEQFPLQLFGAISEDSPFFQLAYQYIRNIEVATVTTNSHSLSQLEARIFFPILNA